MNRYITALFLGVFALALILPGTASAQYYSSNFGYGASSFNIGVGFGFGYGYGPSYGYANSFVPSYNNYYGGYYGGYAQNTFSIAPAWQNSWNVYQPYYQPIGGMCGFYYC